MLTLNEIQQIVTRCTYKPHTEIRVVPVNHNYDVKLVLLMNHVQNVHNPTEFIPIIYERIYPLHDFLDEAFTLKILTDLLMGWERHELCEWFHYKGTQFHNPHA